MRRSPFQLCVRRAFWWLLCICSLWATLWLHSFSGLAFVGQQPASAAEPAAITQTDLSSTTDLSQLVQAGIESYQSELFLEAIAQWQTAYDLYEATQDFSAIAIVSENLASAYHQIGETAQAVAYWDRAIAANQSAAVGDSTKLGQLLTEQAQAYSQLGQPKRAIAILCGREAAACTPKSAAAGSALQIAVSAGDISAQIAALGSLGEASRLSGQSYEALRHLEAGYRLSLQHENPSLKAAILNGLGNTLIGLAQVNYRRASEAANQGAIEAAALSDRANEYNDRAIAYLQQSYELAGSKQHGENQVRSLLSLIPAVERAGHRAEAQQYKQRVIALLNQLPDTQVKAFAAIQLSDLLEPIEARHTALGRSSLPISSNLPISDSVAPQMIALLQQALAIGEALQNSRVSAFALGKLGRIDERAGRHHEAIKHTQAARLKAVEDPVAQDSLYLWDWQIGRLLRAQGNSNAAVQAYAQAVASLERVRSALLSVDRELQFDFRDTVEPIYRQYAALRISEAPSDAKIQPSERATKALDDTLVAIDALRVAELQSYFASDCVIAPIASRVDAIADAQATAVISTALLNQNTNAKSSQLAVIVSFSDGRKKVAQTAADQQTVESVVVQFRRALELGTQEYIADYNQQPAEQLYQWLIRPFETDLADITTLVFVNDGLLRSVPMAALYDGQRYLIEKFAVATTPSLTLTSPERVARPSQLSALLMGVSSASEVPGRQFRALPAVNEELMQVAQALPNSKILLNQALSLSSLRQALNEQDYRILHLATHGTFGFDPNDNFVVMGAKQAAESTGNSSQFNQVLTIGDLDAIIRDIKDPTRAPVELLTLTACETAKGDTRATLGLAGVAVRAGVKSAIASLWAVEDLSSALLISDFYSTLQNSELTKAEALQQAQIAMIKSVDFNYQHPYRWAPFVLIGNWL